MLSSTSTTKGFARVLVAFDGSEVSTRAAEHAARIAKQDGAQFLALHVVRVPMAEVPGGLADYFERARGDAKKWMNDIETMATRNGIGVKAEIVVGAYSIVDTIIGYAEAAGVDLIVSGTRGTTPSRRMLVGSVAGGLVEYSSCAVLVIRESEGIWGGARRTRSPKMAVARLSKVTLRAQKSELGVLLGRVIDFGSFHPIKEKGMEQDIGILVIASRAQDVYGRAGNLLDKAGFGKKGRPGEVERFEAHDVQELVDSLDDYVRIVEEDASFFSKKEEDKEGVVSVLTAVQEASLMVFNDLQRILVYPLDGGAVRFEGFVPTRSVRALKGSMGRFVASVEPVKRQSKDEPYVPSLLVNPKVVSVFEDLTLMRGLPSYGEVDPTPILAFVFPFFFGLMFGDVGHGIALLGFGLFLIYRTAYASWGKQVLVLSLSTTIFGIVRGSFFGLMFPSPVNRVIALPPAFSATFTLSYIPFLLELAVVIGTFHLASGYVISFVNQERAGDYAGAFLNRLPTILLYAFIVPLGFAVAGTSLDLGVLFTSSAPTPVLNEFLGVNIPVSETARISLPVVVAASVWLVVGRTVEAYWETHRPSATLKALGVGCIDTAAKYFEFFMNTLSYVRLGVLLVTTTLLETLTADVLKAGIVGLAIGAFLNVAVISLEGLIIYIQDMRLQLYEWFSSFYNGKGTPFIPLASGGTHFSVRWK